MFYTPFLDYSMLLLIPAMIFGFIAQARVSGAYRKYGEIAARKGWTAAQVASDMLAREGLDVPVEGVRGTLTDHFDPRSNILRLSEGVYGSTSVAAIGIAAHEAGHALQYAQGYAPMKLRALVIPAAQFGSTLAWPLLLIGLLFSFPGLAYAGVVFFGAAVVFQLATLPVEFNASSRAKAALEANGYLTSDELPGAGKVLSAAAMTYIAATLMSIAQFLRLLLLASGSRKRD